MDNTLSYSPTPIWPHNSSDALLTAPESLSVSLVAPSLPLTCSTLGWTCLHTGEVSRLLQSLLMCPMERHPKHIPLVFTKLSLFLCVSSKKGLHNSNVCLQPQKGQVGSGCLSIGAIATPVAKLWPDDFEICNLTGGLAFTATFPLTVDWSWRSPKTGSAGIRACFSLKHTRSLRLRSSCSS